MGFPLSQTPAYSFVKTLLELHIAGYNSRSGRLPRAFGRIKRVCRMISSPADTLFSVVSAPVFLFVGHGVGQNVMFS